MPFSAMSGYKLCVASSTVSLNASEGECPCSRSTSYFALFKALAAAFPPYTSDFENISEVCGKAQAERDIYGFGPIVDHLKPLMANALP